MKGCLSDFYKNWQKDDVWKIHKNNPTAAGQSDKVSVTNDSETQSESSDDMSVIQKKKRKIYNSNSDEDRKSEQHFVGTTTVGNESTSALTKRTTAFHYHPLFLEPKSLFNQQHMCNTLNKLGSGTAKVCCSLSQRSFLVLLLFVIVWIVFVFLYI